MGLQLIFVVETNKKCNSDWIYIKDTVEHVYEYDRTQVKFSPVYMDGKGKYKSPKNPEYEFMVQWSENTRADQRTIEEINRQLNRYYGYIGFR